MKKVLLFLLISITMLGFTQAELLDQVSNNLSSVDSLSSVDAKTQIELSKQEAKIIESETKNQVVSTENYENKVAKDVVKENSKKQSLYSSYLSGILNSDNRYGLFGKSIIDDVKNKNIPVSISKDYTLGIGDIVSIKLWSDLYIGSSEDKAGGVYPFEIGKNGTIFIPNIGSFSVVGKSINSVERDISVEGRKKIKSFNVEITLEKMREISIFVSGEVNNPGYVITNPFANIINILNLAGGVTNSASLRNIRIIRQDKEIEIDLYRYFSGEKNIRELGIQDGDVIYVPIAKNIVLVEGAVNKPAYYEINKEKNYNDLILLAGDFNKYASKLNVEAYSVENSTIKLDTTLLNKALNENLFRVYVNKIDTDKKNQVLILGAVINPNDYAYEEDMTYEDLLKKSGGYIKYSTQNYVTIIRGITDKKVINFNPQIENPKLEMNDEIYVYNYNDINRMDYASIGGAVATPGTYEIHKGTRVLNMIFSAKGIDDTKNPYLTRADLFRIDEDGKVKVLKINLSEVMKGNENENLIIKNNDVIRVYTYDEVVKYDDIFIYGDVRSPGKYRYYKNMTVEDLVFYANGLKNKADTNVTIVRNSQTSNKEFIIDIERNPDFELLEGDLVFVRKKAEWIDTKIVTLAGNVKYPGSYQISPGETMIQVIDRAGGFTKEAFPNGLEFTRSGKKVSNFEYDSGSKKFQRDIELVDGDTIYVPERPTTVKIEGEVYTPGYIVYDSEMDNYKDYVEAAGGYKQTAYKNRTFVIKANGKTVAKPSKTKIEPGDTIYVPLDAREKKGIDRGIELFKGTLEIVSTVALIILLF